MTADLYWLTGDVKSGFEVRTGTLETSFSLPVLPWWTFEEKKMTAEHLNSVLSIFTVFSESQKKSSLFKITSTSGYFNFKCQAVYKELESGVFIKKTTSTLDCKNCSHRNLARHGADWRDLESHSQPLLFFTICLPCVFIKAIVKVIREIRTCKNTPTPP